MSLKLWLPLMGDTHNQGLNNYTITTLGTLSWVPGKLGITAMRAGDGTQVVNGLQLNDNLTTLLNGNYSVSVWLKPYGTHVHYNGSVMSSGNWNTANKRWAFGVSQDNTKVDVLCMNYNTYINCTVPVNEWTHIVCTRGDDDIVKLYKNGEYIGERNCTSDPDFASDASVTCIGRESYASGYFSFNGAIQDLKLYDHCLSPMEVKELSKGLILHYPLNRQGWGQENLAKNAGVRAPDHANEKEYRAFKIGELPITTNEKLAISFDLEMEIGTAVTNGTPYLYIYNTNYRGPHGQWISYTNNTTTQLIPIGNYAVGDIIRQRVSFTITTPSSFNAGSQSEDSIEFYSNYNTENKITITNIKIEKGEIATPWCPHIEDELANLMGLNGTIEYDCSGFCNNGTWHGTHTNTSDTSKYAVSTTATGSGTTYLEGPVLPAEAKTVALWIKNTSKSSNGAIFNDKTSGLQIGLLNSLLYMNSAASTAGFTTTHWVNGEWNHVVAVNNNGTRSLYVNGQAETQSGASNYYIHNADNCWLWNRSYNNSYPFTGSLCDLRVYATALSADDVKSLYQNCATIDPDGTIRGQIRS